MMRCHIFSLDISKRCVRASTSEGQRNAMNNRLKLTYSILKPANTIL